MAILQRLVIYFILSVFLVSCVNDKDASVSEEQWEDGEGELSNKVGISEVNEPILLPEDIHFMGIPSFFEKMPFDMPSGKWFLHEGKGHFGYTLPSGTMEKGEDYIVQLIGHEKEPVPLERKVRLQVHSLNDQLEIEKKILDKTVKVPSVQDREDIFSGKLPEEENILYLFTLEILTEEGHVDDTIASVVYVSAYEINAELTINQERFQTKDQEAILTLNNFGPTILSFGKAYTIEKKVEDTWRVVPLDIAFVEIGIYLNPNKTYQQKIDLESLSPGHYRLVKEIYATSFDLSATLAVEFTIEE